MGEWITATEDAAPAWVSFAALGVSIATLVVSTLWGLYTWRRTGEVLSVSGDLRAPLIRWGHGRPVRTGDICSVLTIAAWNRGRTPVRVHGVYLASRNTKSRTKCQLESGSARLPEVIEARDHARWYIAPETVGVLAKSYGNPVVVRPLIEYGPGLWRPGRLLRIRVGEQYLPAAAPRFEQTFGYRMRTFWRKKAPVR